MAGSSPAMTERAGMRRGWPGHAWQGRLGGAGLADEKGAGPCGSCPLFLWLGWWVSGGETHPTRVVGGGLIGGFPRGKPTLRGGGCG